MAKIEKRKMWVKLTLIAVLVSVSILSIGGGCHWRRHKGHHDIITGSSAPVHYIYELVINSGWWKAASANYENEGGPRHIPVTDATSANYQNTSD